MHVYHVSMLRHGSDTRTHAVNCCTDWLVEIFDTYNPIQLVPMYVGDVVLLETTIYNDFSMSLKHILTVVKNSVHIPLLTLLEGLCTNCPHLFKYTLHALDSIFYSLKLNYVKLHMKFDFVILLLLISSI